MLRQGCNDAFTCMRRTICVVSLSILSAIMVNSMPIDAWAETYVEGSPDALSLRVENAPIIEALTSLGVKIRYRPAADLKGTKTGSYAGTLHQVLARILDG